MTEKRYSYYKSPITGLFVISDEKNRETFSGIDDEYNCNRIVRLLNTKEEENEELKQDLKKQFIPFAKTDEDYTTVSTEEFIKILNENEQLKQENNNLRDFRKFITEKNVFNEKERKKLQLQLLRLYNYFENYFEDTMSPNAFNEMWDNVKEDKRWEND